MELLDVTVGKTFGMPCPNGRFGIEIELEGDRLPIELPEGKWYAKGDGSLRNGMEYISKPTNTPRDDVNALDQLLALSGAVIKPTYRCSTHIHYNFVDRTWKDVLGVLIVWNIAEPLFLRQMPPGRDGSIFCMSAYDTGDMPIHFERFCDALNGRFKHLGFDSVVRQKYASLNLTRLQDLGTIEFRIFPPSVDGREIRKWCIWLDNLVGLVTKLNPEDFASFIQRAEKNPEWFVQEIFGEIPVPADELSAWVDLGCKTAHELVRIFNKVSKKKPRSKKSKLTAEEMMHFIDDLEEE